MIKPKIILFIFAFLTFNAFATQALSQSQPFTFRVVEKPSFVIAGESYKITIEIKNRSANSLTLSSLNAITNNLYWRGKDGSGGGTGGIHLEGKLIIGTNYNPETKEFSCKYFHYEKSDFFTLPVNGAKQFDIEFRIPEEITTSSVVTAEIGYESKYDGSEIELQSWTGKTKTLKVRMRSRLRKSKVI